MLLGTSRRRDSAWSPAVHPRNTSQYSSRWSTGRRGTRRPLYGNQADTCRCCSAPPGGETLQGPLQCIPDMHLNDDPGGVPGKDKLYGLSPVTEQISVGTPRRTESAWSPALGTIPQISLKAACYCRKHQPGHLKPGLMDQIAGPPRNPPFVGAQILADAASQLRLQVLLLKPAEELCKCQSPWSFLLTGSVYLRIRWCPTMLLLGCPPPPPPLSPPGWGAARAPASCQLPEAGERKVRRLELDASRFNGLALLCVSLLEMHLAYQPNWHDAWTVGAHTLRIFNPIEIMARLSAHCLVRGIRPGGCGDHWSLLGILEYISD